MMSMFGGGGGGGGMGGMDMFSGLFNTIAPAVNTLWNQYQAGQPIITQPTSTLTAGQQDVGNALTGMLLGPTGIGQSGYVYGGQRVAGASPLQQQGFNLGGMAPGMGQPIYNQARGIMGNVSQDPSRLFDPVMQATMNTWRQQMAPDIMSRFGGMDGGSSGAAQRVLSREGSNLMQQLAGQLAPMQLQGLQTQVAALPQMQNWANYPMDMATTMAGLGGQQRDIQQQQLTAEMQKAYEADPWRSLAMQYATNVLPTSGQWMENIVYQRPAPMDEKLMYSMDPFGISGMDDPQDFGQTMLFEPWNSFGGIF